MATTTSGSEWRRWDLHVHTPGTARNDNFGTWDDYLVAVEAATDVVAIGVTDYFTIDNYIRMKDERARGRLAHVELLLPNIEFRITPPTSKNPGINIHLLVSPTDPDHVAKIQAALSHLFFEYNKQRYACTRDELRRLGRAHEAAAKSDEAALAAGVNQFKPEFGTFRDWLDGEAWLRANSLVAIAGGADGLGGISRDAGMAATREEITRFCHIIFSARPGEREFWLGLKTDEDRETLKRLGGPRPCLHGSDAHELAKLFRPEGDRFCWIKADRTFEGLRQTLYEPAERVAIGPTPPNLYDEARVISSVTIKDPAGWFPTDAIPLSRGLTAIIGQKGSGKSALAELVALAGGSWHDNDGASFISRAGNYLDHTQIQLDWADGATTDVVMADHIPMHGDVRYLSQRFVERMCAEDHVGTELVREVEAVIFKNLDASETLTASDFSELRAIRTAAVQEERRRLRAGLSELTREQEALAANQKRQADRRARIQALEKEASGLTKQVPPAKTPEEAKRQEQTKAARGALARLVAETAADKERLVKVSNLKTKVAAFATNMNKFVSEMHPLLVELGVSDADRRSFQPGFQGDPDSVLTKVEQGIRAQIAAREGAQDKPAAGTIRKHQQDLQALNDQETQDKARRERIDQIQKRLAAIATEKEKIEREMATVAGPEAARFSKIRDERLDTYVEYFETLRREQTILEDLYGPVRRQLETRGEQERQLDFYIRWNVNLDNWLQAGERLFDQRKTLPYASMDELAKTAAALLAPAWSAGTGDQIRKAIDEFIEPFRKGNITGYLRTDVTMTNLLDWIFSVDHIALTYGLRYGGVELEKLSPGTKGIALLILYLGVDMDDTRPLIIDQPEENLDSESIYSLLVQYFREAKKRRQIVLITHNPNLVVNADAEEVIVARSGRGADGLPRFSYVSGALEDFEPEDTAIRPQVCRILEGGAKAFLDREKRYALPR